VFVLVLKDWDWWKVEIICKEEKGSKFREFLRDE
jgi:hypothetical protein